MCCEVSYLYVGLLTQLSYLTYVGFLNIPSQTQGVIFNVAFEFGYKRIAQISWLNSAWLISRLDGSDLGLAWSDHGSMARITTQWLRGSDLEMVLTWDLNSVARWLGSISAHQNIYPTNGSPFFFFFFLNFEFWILNFEFWILNFEFWILNWNSKFKNSKFEIFFFF